MIAASYGPVSDFEILWTLIAVLGFCFSLYNIWDSYCDLKAVESSSVNGAMRIVAKSHFIGETIRGIILLIFAIIGTLSMTIPDYDIPNLPIHLRVFGAIIRWGILIAACLLVSKSVLEFIDRRRLRAILEGEQKND